MKTDKKMYVAPEAEVFALRPAAFLCTSPASVYHDGGAGFYDTDEMNDNGDY